MQDNYVIIAFDHTIKPSISEWVRALCIGVRLSLSSTEIINFDMLTSARKLRHCFMKANFDLLSNSRWKIQNTNVLYIFLLVIMYEFLAIRNSTFENPLLLFNF